MAFQRASRGYELRLRLVCLILHLVLHFRDSLPDTELSFGVVIGSFIRLVLLTTVVHCYLEFVGFFSGLYLLGR